MVHSYMNPTSYSLGDGDLLYKKTKVTTCYVDVKSELLRDILRYVLHDIRGISLNESKLSVSCAFAVMRPVTYCGQDRTEPALQYPSRARAMPELEYKRSSRSRGNIASWTACGLPEKRIRGHDTEYDVAPTHRRHHVRPALGPLQAECPGPYHLLRNT